MPFIPSGLPGFTIRPPCTLHDATGEPSNDLYADVKRVFDFIDDERHLTAHRLWCSVQQRLQEAEHRYQQQQQKQQLSASSSLNRKIGVGIGSIFSHSQNLHRKKKERRGASVHFENLYHDIQKIKELLERKKNLIDKLENCCRIFLRAQRDLAEAQDWTLASTLFGVTTFYRRETDGSLSIKLEGNVEASNLFEQICVLREVDLHYRWSPICNSSLKIADINKLDGVGWFVLGMPSLHLARDGCFRAIGCDNILEDGSILIAGQGIHDIMPGAPPHQDPYLSEDPILQNLNIPPIPNRSGCGRMTIRQVKAEIKINSPTSITTKLIANINPNLSLLPDSLLEFVMKHAAGVALTKLQNAARKAAQYPVTNVHAQRMRDEKEFYIDWLLPKFKGVCEARGWDMPRIAAFELTHHERHRLQQQQRIKRLRTSKAETFNAGGITDSHHLPSTIEVDDSASNGVVANLSQVSNDSNRMRAETESLSAISTESGKGSIWLKSNPMSVLRERDLKKKQQKEQAIADARRKAEERIIPRELSLPEKQRLEELKLSKERRRGNEVAIPEEDEAIAVCSPPPDSRHWLSQSAYIFIYLVLFFMMLHIDLLAIQISKGLRMVKYHHIETLESVMVVGYILFVAAVFYMIGVFVLHCAFESLEISRKTGRKTKLFYHSFVKKSMGLVSFSIVVASLLKGLLNVGVQRLIASVFSSTFSPIFTVASNALWLLPEDVRYRFDGIFEATNMLSTHAISILSYLIKYGVFLLLFPLKLIFSARDTKMMPGQDEAEALAFGCSEFPEESSVAISWSREAFDTARTMFQYTSFFICALFVIYAEYLKRTRSKAIGITYQTTQLTESYASAVETDTRFPNGDYLSSEDIQPVTPDTSPSTVEEKNSRTSASNNSTAILRLRFRRKFSSTHSLSISQDDGPRIPVDDSQSKACSY